MTTQDQVINLITPKVCREFDINETDRQLIFENPNIIMSWGVSKRINLSNKGLLMKVNGHHFKGWVCITLDFMDTYSIFYVDNNQIVGEQHNVYCDMLRDVIDDRIERIKEYVR